jgi:hypothetical protein
MGGFIRSTLLNKTDLGIDMHKINIMGIDPSLRNTGYCMLIYDKETETMELQHCGILKNPRYNNKGTEAIKNMIGLVKGLLEEEWAQTCKHVVIESPLKAFWAGYQAGALIGVAHIAGAAAAYASLERVTLVYPGDWNGRQKKEKTQLRIQDMFGDCDTWDFETKVNEADYEHVIDAVGMCYWLLETLYLKEDDSVVATVNESAE